MAAQRIRLEEHILQPGLRPQVWLSHVPLDRLISKRSYGLGCHVTGRCNDETVWCCTDVRNGLAHDLSHQFRRDFLVALALDTPFALIKNRHDDIWVMSVCPWVELRLLGKDADCNTPNVETPVCSHTTRRIEGLPSAEVVSELANQILETVRLQVLEVERANRSGDARHQLQSHVRRHAPLEQRASKDITSRQLTLRRTVCLVITRFRRLTRVLAVWTGIS
jgi:hypothetical protein